MKKTVLLFLLATLVLGLFVVPVRYAESSEQLDGKLSAALIEKIASTTDDIPLLIEAFSQPYTSIVEDVVNLGGTVTYEYKYISGLAASLPANQIEFLALNPNVENISLDLMMSLPEDSLQGQDDALYTGLSEEEFFSVEFAAEDLIAREDIDSDGDVDIVDAAILARAYRSTAGDPNWNARADVDRDGDVDIVDAAMLASRYGQRVGLEPTNFVNSAVSGVTVPLLTGSGFGEDSLIAVMDTGINTRHFLLSRPGMVVGGVDISCDAILHFFCTPPRTGFPGFDRPENQFHGSFVTSVAAGSGAAAFLATSVLANAIELHTGARLPDGPPDPMGRATKIVTLSGIAPMAHVYVVKVFDHTGLGISESVVIAGIEHIIDKKVVDGLDIDIVNMSLGGATLFDGRDLLDRAADAATKAGLAMALAAGNDGPAPMTVASAGSANTVITVGAAVTAVHARVFRDNQLGTVGIGNRIYVNDAHQIREFSSRGPTSDGRSKPDIVAAGSTILAAFAERSSTGLAFGSGTSFSTPGVAGVVALLNSYAERNSMPTSPFDYKQALTASARPISGWSTADQGAGFVDAGGALSALLSDTRLGDTQPHIPKDGDLFDITNLSADGDTGGFSFPGITLAPGFGRNFVFAVPRMDSITVRISNVNLGTSTFETGLAGSQEVPPVAAALTGSFSASLNAAQTELTFRLDVSGPDLSRITASHIHVGARGVNGPIILFLFNRATEGVFSGSKTGMLTAADLIPRPASGVNTFADFVTKMLAGETYANVHTDQYLGGEIRGQIRANDPLGLNSFEVYVKGSRRTASLSDYHVDSANVFGDGTITVTDDSTTLAGDIRLPPCIGAIRVAPCATGRQIDFITTRTFVMQPGFYKIRIENDFTSGGTISGDLTIEYDKAAADSHDFSISGQLKRGKFTGFIPIPVPAGASKAIIETSWLNDWAHYPTSDLDMFIVNGTRLDFSGATLNSPERVVILNPASNLAVGVEAFDIRPGRLGAATGAGEPFTITVDFVM